MLIEPSIKCSDRIEAKSGSGNSRLEISSPSLVGHRDPHRSIAHVAAIKRALADRASIRLDLNQAWNARASYLPAALIDAGFDLVEQSIANAKGMGRLC
ncbi:hypothetical protein B5V03_01070 [Bradyrhizobium betae]|uniref:Uncharacterized protein n=1 Tax=Bradyrhizobium betae TaxID=244734 RepID=A0A4Q1VRC8_9BRAD|nr:hypothetical protein B5V03_01070 [Bradyrhizobium betae]